MGPGWHAFLLPGSRRKLREMTTIGFLHMLPFLKRAIVSGVASAGILGGAVLGWAGHAEAANLISYRALYDVRLVEAKRGAGISAASGNIAYGVQKTCDGWLVNQTGTMVLQTGAGDNVPQALNFSSWESTDGTSYRFSVLGADDGAAADGTILGGASMTSMQSGGQAQFSKPAPLRFALPKGTLFPMQHTRYILQQAADGQTQFENSVFEGTDVEGAKLLVTFVSPQSDGAVQVAKRFSQAQVNRPGWNFRLAYFDPGSRTGVPLYEIEADYLDNGVPLRWMLDYGDFVIEMALSKLEVLDNPDC